MPFTACITCPKLGNGCDGPNFFSLPATDVLEWCKTRKADLRLSNARLAELSGVPKGTIDYVFGTSRVDFKFETMRPIIRVLVGGEFHGNPCPDPNGDMAARIEELEQKNAALHRVIKENKSAYDDDLKRERSDADRRVDYLKAHIKEKNKIIKVLSIALSFSVLLVLVALLIDFLRPDIGFIWTEIMDAIISK